MKKTVIIAAAGMGNRLGEGLPKCLVEAAGHAIFEYQLKAFQWADEIRMVVGYQADEVIKRVSKINSNVKFICNHAFSSTTTLQSYFSGVQGVEGNALFIDGDMIISKAAAEILRQEYERGEPFIAVAEEITGEPVYAGVENMRVQWFSYDRPAKYEWANIAMLNPEMLENNHTHFYIQLEKYLPLKAVVIDRLEVDTPDDLRHTEEMLAAYPDKYDLGRN